MNKFLTLLLSLWTLGSFAQVVDSPIRFRLNGTYVNGKFRRDLALYPYQSGFAAAKAAAESATRPFAVTITSGSRLNDVLPALSTPNAGSTVPAWMPTVQYTYGASKLVIEATASSSGQTPWIAFSRVDGQPMTGLSGGNTPLASGTFYHPGPLSGQGSYVWEWTWQSGTNATGVPAGVAVRLLFRQGTDNSITYTRDFTPTVGTRINLLTAGSSAPPTSNTVTAPPSTTTANGDFVAYADQGWGSADMKYLENSDIRVGFRKSVGATICHISLKSDNRGLVNDFKVEDALPGDPRYGTRFSDKGRQVQFGSDYFTPGVRWQVTPTKNTGNYGFDTGGNVVQGGSLGRYYDESEILASATVQHPKYGTLFYAKVRPRVWAVPGEYGPVVLEEWVWLNGRDINYHARHTYSDRDYSQVKYEAREQENPCVMGIGWLANKKAVFGTPFAGAGSDDVRKYPFAFSGPYLTTECWTGMYDHSGNHVGLTLYTPDNSRFQNNQDRDIYGDEDKYEVAYINACRLTNYDQPGVYDDGGHIIVGTEAEARTIINALPRPDQSIDFDFTGDNHHWWNIDCKVKREAGPASARWKVYIGDVHFDAGNGSTSYVGKFASPFRAWKASEITQIKFDMAVTGATQLRFFWQKTGWLNGLPEYETTLNVTGDGTRRTYTVNVAGLPNWDGVISTFGLQANSGTQSGATLIPYRIYKP